MFWSSIYVDPTNHGLRQSTPSDLVDPIQPRILTKLALASESFIGRGQESLISLAFNFRHQCTRFQFRQAPIR